MTYVTHRDSPLPCTKIMFRAPLVWTILYRSSAVYLLYDRGFNDGSKNTANLRFAPCHVCIRLYDCEYGVGTLSMRISDKTCRRRDICLHLFFLLYFNVDVVDTCSWGVGNRKLFSKNNGGRVLQEAGLLLPIGAVHPGKHQTCNLCCFPLQTFRRERHGAVRVRMLNNNHQGRQSEGAAHH